MHPAFSVIFLTTLIGAGQGLFLALYTGQLYALAQFAAGPGAELLCRRQPAGPGPAGRGLVASFFHLGRPERAWRTAAKWRTSWLSREVIVLPVVMGLVFPTAWPTALELTPGPVHPRPASCRWTPTLVLGLLGTLVTFALFVCTAMIYAGVQIPAGMAQPR